MQGERVKVRRLAGGATPAGGVQEVLVRPGFETKPASAAEIAAIKEREHALRHAEVAQKAEAKRREMMELKRRAELLEVDTQNLLAEASQEKVRVDRALEDKATVEQREWSYYAQAEEAERARRQVVGRAAPLAQSAEQREAEALRLRQLASDTQYHAQVLEDKARALLMESEEMAQLRQARVLDEQQLAAQLLIAKRDEEEVKLRLKDIQAGDLPTYVEECLAEIGRMSHRIRELREEVEWAKNQMEATHYEALTWERLAMAKQTATGQFRLRLAAAKEEAELAHARQRQAAEEAQEPIGLAERKYEEAQRLAEEAERMEAEARSLQEQALGISEEAKEPYMLREEKLRSAGQAELLAKQIEAQTELAASRVAARLHEAEVSAETAAMLAQQAQRVEGEVERVSRVVEQEREMAEAYATQRERHIEAPPLLASA